MIATIRSEWIKLRTVRSHLVLVIFAVAFPWLVTLLTVSLIKDTDLANDTLVRVLVNSARVSSILLGVVAVLGICGEFTYHTIRPTFAATPNRTRVLLAKMVVSALGAAVVMAVIIGAGYVAGRLIVDSRVDQLGHFGDTNGLIAGMMGFTVLYVIAAVAIGALLRNQGATIALLIVWPLIAEPLLGGLLHLVKAKGLVNFLPFNAGFRMIEHVGDGTFGRWGSTAVFAGFAALMTALAIVVVGRRDA